MKLPSSYALFSLNLVFNEFSRKDTTLYYSRYDSVVFVAHCPEYLAGKNLV